MTIDNALKNYINKTYDKQYESFIFIGITKNETDFTAINIDNKAQIVGILETYKHQFLS